MTRIGRVTLLNLALLAGALALAGTPSAALAADPVDRAAAGANVADAEHSAALGHNAHGDDHNVSANLIRGTSEGLIVGLTTLIVFLGLVAILGKYAWGPITTGLKAREDKIRKDIADAEAARARAEATLREYQAQLAAAEAKVQQLIAQATAQGEQVANNIKTQAQRDAEEMRSRATRDIESASEQAVAKIYEQAADLSTAIAEKILRRNLNADDQRELVNQSLHQLQTIKA